MKFLRLPISAKPPTLFSPIAQLLQHIDRGNNMEVILFYDLVVFYRLQINMICLFMNKMAIFGCLHGNSFQAYLIFFSSNA